MSKKGIAAWGAAVAMAVAGLTVIGMPVAHADNGSCGQYASGWATNSYCGNYSGHIVTIAATKATWAYGGGSGGILIRTGNYVGIGRTSYISAQAGDTGSYGCDKMDEAGPYRVTRSSCA